MNYLFYISSIVAIVATVMVITRYHPVHALLYLVVSFLAVSMIFLSLGSPFVAILEIILYAGAIIVLFIFVVMMLNIGSEAAAQEKQWVKAQTWAGPTILTAILLAELLVLMIRGDSVAIPNQSVPIKEISFSLYKEYIIAVELVGFLLMAGIVGAAHIGRHKKRYLHRFLREKEERESMKF